jgi:hypothetical protein
VVRAGALNDYHAGENITIHFDMTKCHFFDAETEMATSIGKLNFFKWSIENGVLDYIENNFDDIEQDMNNRNSLAKRRTAGTTASSTTTTTEEEEESVDMAKTRKKREELSVSACKCIKKEHVKIVVRFN